MNTVRKYFFCNSIVKFRQGMGLTAAGISGLVKAILARGDGRWSKNDDTILPQTIHESC